MLDARAIYNRRKEVKRLCAEGLTAREISSRLDVPLFAIRKDISYLEIHELPNLEDKFNLAEIAERLGVSKHVARLRLVELGHTRADVVFIRESFYRKDVISRLPKGTLRKERETKEPARLDIDLLHKICALRAAGIKFPTVLELLGMTQLEAKQLLNLAQNEGIYVHQIIADYYADLCLSAYRAGREIPPPPPMGCNISLISRITAFIKGVPIELISLPNDTCWSPEVGEKEIARNRSQLHPDEYAALQNLSRFKVAVWKMRHKQNRNGYHREENTV